MENLLSKWVSNRTFLNIYACRDRAIKDMRAALSDQSCYNQYKTGFSSVSGADALQYHKARVAMKEAGEALGEALRGENADRVVLIFNDLRERINVRALRRIISKFNEAWYAETSDGESDQFYVCGCGEVACKDDSTYSQAESEYFCDSCKNDRFVYSNIMEDWILEQGSAPYYESARAYNNNDSDYIDPNSSEANEAYVHNGDYFSSEAYYDLGFNEDDDDDDGDDVPSYHSTKSKLMFIPCDKPVGTYHTVGMELEFEVEGNLSETGRKITSLMNKHHPKYFYCGFEHDGSLDRGFEVVTSYMHLDLHRASIAELVNVSGLSAEETCGLHVHISKDKMSLLQATKMVAFIHAQENAPLIRTIARRYGKVGDGGYAKFDWGKDKAKSCSRNSVGVFKSSKAHGYDHDRAKLYALRNLNDDRYEALNFQNEHTVEFRLFAGSTDPDTIMACAEFAVATAHFCNHATVKNLTTEAFMEFILQPSQRKDTRVLRKYLLAKFDPFKALIERRSTVVAAIEKIEAAPAPAPAESPAPFPPEVLRMAEELARLQQSGLPFTIAA